MNRQKPFIHPITTSFGKYVYDVNRDNVYEAEESLFHYLCAEQNGDDESMAKCLPEVSAKLTQMKEDGYLKTKRPDRIEHQFTPLIDDKLSHGVEKITLQVTQQCNLRCKYCTYSETNVAGQRVHSPKVMSWETAKAGVDFLVRHSENAADVNIGFYGGEPLLQFNLIKKVVAYAEEELYGKGVTFSITTNGTIFTDEIIQFFMEHKIFILISLDGPSEMHNANRIFKDGKSGTFEKIEENMKYISENFPALLKKISFNTVLDPSREYDCINSFFMEYWMFQETIGTVASMVDTSYKDYDVQFSTEFVKQNMYEQFKIFMLHIGRLRENELSKFTLASDGLNQYFLKNHGTAQEIPDVCAPSGPCLPGQSRLFMNVDGDFYPCERVSESSCATYIGNVTDGFDYECIRQVLNVGAISAEHCKNCWALLHCGLCIKHCDENDAISAEKKLKYCESQKNSAEERLRDIILLKKIKELALQ